MLPILQVAATQAVPGSPVPFILHSQAICACFWLFVKQNISAMQIALFGRSLGGAVAIYLAASNPQAVKAVMIENTFTSIEEVAPKASTPAPASCTQRHLPLLEQKLHHTFTEGSVLPPASLLPRSIICSHRKSGQSACLPECRSCRCCDPFWGLGAPSTF